MLAWFGEWENAWIPLLLMAAAMAAPKVLQGTRGLILRLIGGEEYGAYLRWLNSEDSLAAKKAIYSIGDQKDRPILTRKILENAYTVAGRKGCKASGWQRRALIYYWFGKKRGKW
jgi:hypothetical protein